MKVCQNCGNLARDDAKFCQVCGTAFADSPAQESQQEEPSAGQEFSFAQEGEEREEQNFSFAQEDGENREERAEQGEDREQGYSFGSQEGGYSFDALGKSVGDSAKKAADGVKSLAQSFGSVHGEQRAPAAAQPKAAPVRMSVGSNERYMAQDAMWTWLKKDSTRDTIFTEEVSPITEDEFAEAVNARLAENQVPAQLQEREVRWDRSNVTRTNYFIRLLTNAVNPISVLVLFNHVGKFTFVEQKKFIAPPDLPEVPGQKLPMDPALTKRLLVTVLLCVIFLLLGIAVHPAILLGALACGGLAFVFYQKYDQITKHNRHCEEQERAWDAAWSNWQKSIFLYSFQEDTDGELTRIYDAAIRTIKQTAKELLEAKETLEEDDRSDMNELEQMIARHKEEYR